MGRRAVGPGGGPAPGQLALWLIAQSGVSHDTYTVSLVYELCGTLDKRALRAAFNALLDRHEAHDLRSGSSPPAGWRTASRSR